MRNFLKTIGIENILMLVLAQVAIKYFFFAPFNVPTALFDYKFMLLVLASFCIAAGGQYLNYAQKHPAEIGRRKAQNVFVVLNIIAVGIGFYLSNALGVPVFTAIFIIASALVYVYVTSLKEYAVIGNIVLSFLVTLGIFVEAIYDLVPIMNDQIRQTQLTYFSILFDYSAVVFFINWMREMAKDQLHISDDHDRSIKTLPILLGRKRANTVFIVLNTILLGGLFYYMYTYLYHNTILLIFTLTAIAFPLLVIFYLVVKAKNPQDYKIISQLLFAELFMAIISLSLYQFIL